MEENTEISQMHEQKLGKFYTFFCWCSGARLYLLNNCPTEYNKYFGIGTIVFFTGILAALTGTHAMFTVFENIAVSIVLGMFWGVLIFSLDWYIVSSLRKENKIGKELMSAFPRLLLSVILSIVISKPLELRLFQNEIMKEITVMKRDNEINYQDMVFEEFDEIGKLEEENRSLTEVINNKEKERLALFDMIIAEAEGRSPTNTIGKGPVYKEKKLEYDKVSEEIEKLRERNDKIIENNLERISELKEKRDGKVEEGFVATSEYDGFLARLEALGSLSARNRNIYFANVFILILFILLESSPVLVKLLSKRGPYDVLLDSEEMTKTFDTENRILKMNSSLDDEIISRKQKKKMKNEARAQVLDHYYHQLVEAGKEMNQVKIDRWKEKETKKISSNFEDEAQNISNTLNAQ